ncbi:uncharacterized protein ARMOST_00557 [Armillaria ostoyae]|uniref:Uncharacterized protein n=1 Tax=Armillaria ostoyae TaxID=47428 RepID=A0A284QLH2_ARMOS|nr:uncharacterized protein ARMOST_00557 [Armillaria ostoyae]
MKIPEEDEGAEVVDLKKKCRTKEDTQLCNESYFLSHSEAKNYLKEAIGEMLVMDPDEADGNDPSPCSDRWRNMVNDQTSRMWGIYDETGIFVSLCRHGFVLVAADMVRSGELAKYPIAIVDKLLDVFGEDLGVGYDIGCKFLCNNYLQAVNTIREMPTLLHSMKLLGVDSKSRFEEWLKEEREYLDSLKKEPETETLDMEYYTELVQLYNLEAEWKSMQTNFANYTQVDYSGSKDMTSKRETDEENYLLHREEVLQKTDPCLAYQIYQYCLQRSRFHDLHLQRFHGLHLALAKIGYTKTFSVGEAENCVGMVLHLPSINSKAQDEDYIPVDPNVEGNDSDNEEDEMEIQEEVASIFAAIS